MSARTFFRRIKAIAVIVLLVIMLPLASWAGSAGQPLMVKKPPILDTFPEIFDPELATMRGRYDTFYFGLDIILNLTGSGPLFTLNPHPGMPVGTVVTSTGISYQDDDVTYLAGLDRRSIFQAVKVTGDNNIVTGVVNLDILIPQSMLTRRSPLSLPKGSLTGLTN
jgi:hypothetical protein